MTEPSHEYNEFLCLLGTVRDEQIEADQVEQLEMVMTDNPQARKMYIQFMSIHGLLEHAAVIPTTVQDPGPATTKGAAPTFARFWPLAVVAATLAIIIPAWWFLNQGKVVEPSPFVAGDPAPVLIPDATFDVVTFLIEPPSRGGPPIGNFDPSLFESLLPNADVIVYGKVNSIRKKQVDFTILETLRGNAKDLKVDTSKGPQVGCVPAVINWTVGKECCLFLQFNAKTKLYRPVYYGAGVQEMPYREIVKMDTLREIIRVYDVEYRKRTPEQAKLYYQTAGEREKLVYDIVYKPYRNNDFKTNIAKLSKLLEGMPTTE